MVSVLEGLVVEQAPKRGVICRLGRNEGVEGSRTFTSSTVVLDETLGQDAASSMPYLGRCSEQEHQSWEFASTRLRSSKDVRLRDTRSQRRPQGWTPFREHEYLLNDVSDRLYCVRDSIPRGEGPAKDFNISLTKVFMGPAGTVSRLHHDTYATHVWLSQIRGRKQFVCYPPDDTEFLHYHEDDECEGRTTLFDPAAPDFERFPKARRARAYSVVVEEGETVVLPSKWWHWAKSLTPSVTLMRNFVNEVNMQEHLRIQEKARRARDAKAQR